jgi:putative nucleotidyltransferase with HDIG domain
VPKEDSIPLEVLQILDICILTFKGDNTLRVLGRSPGWLHFLLPDCLNMIDLYSIQTPSLVLDHFLKEARSLWLSDQDDILVQELWVEECFDGIERTLAIEAEAVRNLGQNLLLLRNKTSFYKNKRELLQKVRDRFLNEERLIKESAEKAEPYMRGYQEFAARIVSATRQFHGQTEQHTRRVKQICEAIAGELGWPVKEISILKTAANLHDIGNLSVSIEKLRKPGPLTSQEFEEIKQHTVTGAAFLEGSDLPLFEQIRKAILYHHECWDGSGYPEGLKAEEIPLAARILKIADVFDTLVSERPYRKKHSVPEAKKIIAEGAGIQYDPQMVKIFNEIIDKVVESW